MTVRHPYCFARRRSSRPSPLVVWGSGTKQRTSRRGGGATQKSLSSHLAPCGFDTTSWAPSPPTRGQCQSGTGDRRIRRERGSRRRAAPDRSVDERKRALRGLLRRSAADRRIPRIDGCADNAKSPPSPKGNEVSLAVSHERRLMGKADGCPAFRRYNIAGQDLNLCRRHVEPMAGPPPASQRAVRLIAHPVHHTPILRQRSSGSHRPGERSSHRTRRGSRFAPSRGLDQRYNCTTIASVCSDDGATIRRTDLTAVRIGLPRCGFP